MLIERTNCQFVAHSDVALWPVSDEAAGQPAGPAFQEKAKCISCHNQSLPAVAVKLAGDKGIKLNRDLARHPTQATLELWGLNRENMMVGNCSIFGFLGNVTYGMLGLAERVCHLIRRQTL